MFLCHIFAQMLSVAAEILANVYVAIIHNFAIVVGVSFNHFC